MFEHPFTITDREDARRNLAMTSPAVPVVAGSY